jgi:hypothetical protein
MKRKLAIAAGMITIILLVSGLWCWFVPVHRTDYTSHGDSENTIRAIPNVKVYEDILFPADSFNQQVFVSFASNRGNFSLIMLTSSNLQDYTNNESYSALFEAMNVTSISETVNLTEPVTKWITIILFSTIDELYVRGGVGTQCDVYYRLLTPILFALAIISLVIAAIPSAWRRISKG